VNRAALIVLAALTFARGSAAGAPGGPVFLIGIDGASWDLMDPLLAAGRLPNLSALMKSGCHAALRSDDTLNSAVVWTTIATGKTRQKHGIESWDLELGQPPSTLRKVKAVWNILGDAGARVLLSYYMASWPAEDLNGVNITPRWDSSVAVDGTISPKDAFAPAGEAAARRLLTRWPRTFPQSPSDPNSERARDDARLDVLTRALSQDESAASAAELFLSKGGFDFFAIHLWGLDWVSHWFLEAGAGEGRATVDAYYERADALVGRLLRFSRERATVMVVSDHGFKGAEPSLVRKNGRWRPTGAHAPAGILILGGPRAGRCASRGDASVLDVAPTILHMMGSAVGEDMDGEPLTRFLSEDFSRSNPVKRIATHDTAARPLDARKLTADPETLELLRKMGYIR